MALLWGLANGGRPRRVGDAIVVEAVGSNGAKLLGSVGSSGSTLGQVVLTSRTAISPGLLAHELAHVRQFQRLGPAMVPAYAVLWALCGYREHPLERAARRAVGPPRDVR